jgi:hypothetical protein
LRPELLDATARTALRDRFVSLFEQSTEVIRKSLPSRKRG